MAAPTLSPEARAAMLADCAAHGGDYTHIGARWGVSPQAVRSAYLRSLAGKDAYDPAPALREVETLAALLLAECVALRSAGEWPRDQRLRSALLRSLWERARDLFEMVDLVRPDRGDRTRREADVSRAP